MGGLYGVTSSKNCTMDLFYGTDYHSHLGTKRGGLAVIGKDGFKRKIHNIEMAQFRSKFESDLPSLSGNMGIGCISDTDDQPIVVGSALGKFAIVTVGKIINMDEIVQDAYSTRSSHFSEMSNGLTNPTEVVATIIAQQPDFKLGIQAVQEIIEGSCTLLILTPDGIFAARDRFGRTPLVIGEKDGAFCAASESCSFPNLGYEFSYELGPGEIVFLTPEGIEKISPPGDILQICSFLWVYYGYPGSNYEGINCEIVRNRNGEILAEHDENDKNFWDRIDMVSGVPDSGLGHAIGYTNRSKIPYGRPFVKYTPTWPRSFMPQDQKLRDLVARMKLIPIRELIEGKRLLFCEDSIVRGTQLRETVKLLKYEFKAGEIHVRPGCPPLIHSCKFLNFSRSRSDLALAAKKEIFALEKKRNIDAETLAEYADHKSTKNHDLVSRICKRLKLDSLKYQTLPGLITAIGLPKEKLCTYCWDKECPSQTCPQKNA